jgi:pimeloyl-ACP methyl ester carboxylesterase
MNKAGAGQPDLVPDRQMIDTRFGPIEYARRGEGTPVVVLHGSPGGIDAAALMAGFLPRDAVSAILLSRPGYLGTDLGERRSIDEQADLIAALLDALDIPSAGVLSWSGGGPCGYRLAVRHPDRVRALVAFAALSKAYEEPAPSLGDRLMFTTSTGLWLMRVLAAHRPAEFVAGTLRTESSLTGDALKARVAEVFADPAKLQFVLDLGPTASQTKARRAGYENDLAQFAAIDSLELGRITAPTLVIQGTADTDVTPDHSSFAASTVPGARRLDLVDGSHLALYTHPDAADAQRQVVEHLLT